MTEVFICDDIRTPIGRFGGALSSVRADDLGAIPLRALMARNAGVDWEAVDDVIFGCANQAGEDNRNVARMSSLLAGLPAGVPGTTINRLCGSGMDAVITAARAIKAGEAALMIAGGVESMSRAPLVMPKAETAFSRHAEIYDTTIGLAQQSSRAQRTVTASFSRMSLWNEKGPGLRRSPFNLALGEPVWTPHPNLPAVSSGRRPSTDHGLRNSASA